MPVGRDDGDDFEFDFMECEETAADGEEDLWHEPIDLDGVALVAGVAASSADDAAVLAPVPGGVVTGSGTDATEGRSTLTQRLLMGWRERKAARGSQ